MTVRCVNANAAGGLKGTRLISAIFGRGGDAAFVGEELKAVFDPRGGGWPEGICLPGVPALISLTLGKHFRSIGYLPPAGGQEGAGAARGKSSAD